MCSKNCKKMLEETQCELVTYDSLPEYLKDNEFILGYYRCEWPLKKTMLSIFSIHNETLNVWTHLIGFLIFLSLTILAATVMTTELQTCSASPIDSTQPPSCHHVLDLNHLLKRFSSSNNHTSPSLIVPDITDTISIDPVTRWPFFAFLTGAMFCLLTSSFCHLVSCHSERTAYAMLRLDYAGISALIVTSAYPLVYYSFLCNPFFSNLYISFITAFGVATISVSLVPVFQTAEYRTVRALLFFCMGASGLVPIMHKLIAFSDRPEVVVSTGYEILMGIFYGVGVLVYATRVPERWMPGKFDLVGHSHQLFHVLVIAGAYTHYLATLQYHSMRPYMLNKCCLHSATITTTSNSPGSRTIVLAPTHANAQATRGVLLSSTALCSILAQRR